MTRFLGILLVCLFPAAAQAGDRCAFSLLHYNIQYVAGGAEGMAEELGLDVEAFDWSEEGIEDAIIVESFVPLLGQVSDSTGWNPFRTETEYSLTHLNRAIELATAVAAELLPDHAGTEVWLVADQRTVHLAASYDVHLGAVQFIDETLAWDEGDTWRFLLAPDADTAVEAGLAVNAAAPVQLALPAEHIPDDAPGEEGDCSCRLTGGAARAPWWLTLAALYALRRVVR